MFMESVSLNARREKKVMESVAFNANDRANTSRPMKSNYSSTDNLNFKSNYSQTNSYIGNMLLIICDYYKKLEHTRDKYYKLHGYPQTNNQNPPGLTKSNVLWMMSMVKVVQENKSTGKS